MRAPHEELATLLRDAYRVVMAMLVGASGSTPKQAGARMWLEPSGNVRGTVTIGGCVDGRVTEAATEVMESGTPQLLSLSLGNEDAWEIGLTCGGNVEVLVERIERGSEAQLAYDRAGAALSQRKAAAVVCRLDDPSRRLVVTGAGETRGSLGDGSLDRRGMEGARTTMADELSRIVEPDDADGVRLFAEHLAPPRSVIVVGASDVARSLVPLLRPLGFRTAVVDPRERLLSAERFPDADERHVGIPSRTVEALPIDARTAVVLLAHDHKFEVPVLRHVLRSSAGYVGMLGGRRRVEGIRAMLRDEGITDEELGRLRAPIGLDIGAASSAEIALAIAAELVALSAPAGKP